MRISAKEFLEEIKEHYPGLRLHSYDNSVALYKGTLAFRANYQDHGLIDETFEIEIMFPLQVSEISPTAKEIGGQIPKTPEFHINGDETMCLAAPLEVRRKYLRDSSLHAFINQQVIPFLYGYSIKTQKGYWPFGELPHGGEGIAEYYKKHFNVQSDLAVIELLKILVEDNYRGHVLCPCGQENKLRHCHGPQILEIKGYQSREKFFSDFIECLRLYLDSGQKLPHRVNTKKLRSYWSKMQK